MLSPASLVVTAAESGPGLEQTVQEPPDRLKLCVVHVSGESRPGRIFRPCAPLLDCVLRGGEYPVYGGCHDVQALATRQARQTCSISAVEPIREGFVLVRTSC